MLTRDQKDQVCVTIAGIYMKKSTDPIGQAFRRLKSHAKQRGKEFEITKEEFSQFCVKSEYLQRKGIQKECYHIDRIDEMKGYSLDNIQVLTNSENIKKYCKWAPRRKWKM